MKIIQILLLALLLCLTVSKKFVGQDKQDLIINIDSNDINGNNFNGHVFMTIKNISNDTIYIPIEPLYCFSLHDSSILYFMGKYKKYSPNSLFFIRHNATLDCRDASSKISFLKYPNILYLYPEKNTTIHFNIERELLKELKNDKWNIKVEFGYAYKSDIDTTLANKPYFLDWEFKHSLYFCDTILVETGLGKSYGDTTLYFNKDGINYDYNYYSFYDLIMLKCFIQRIFIL
jgi:hypothetical protein